MQDFPGPVCPYNVEPWPKTAFILFLLCRRSCLVSRFSANRILEPVTHDGLQHKPGYSHRQPQDRRGLCYQYTHTPPHLLPVMLQLASMIATRKCPLPGWIGKLQIAHKWSPVFQLWARLLLSKILFLVMRRKRMRNQKALISVKPCRQRSPNNWPFRTPFRCQQTHEISSLLIF